jgi:hypothetical protein
MASQVLFDGQIINAQTTGTFPLPFSSGVSPYEDGKAAGQPLEFTFHVLFGAGTTAGVIKVETSHDPAFTGTWAVIATVSWATANTAHYVSLTGCFRALRLRFSSDAVNGTASAWMIANSR